MTEITNVPCQKFVFLLITFGYFLHVASAFATPPSSSPATYLCILVHIDRQRETTSMVEPNLLQK